MASISSERSLRQFMARLDKDPSGSGCWLWRGATHNGYGRLTRRVDGRSLSLKAHRFAYAVFTAPIPDGMSVLHRCDNPRCCNPAHLFLGTQRENVHDMETKGRARHPTGRAHGSAKLTDDDVLAILRLVKRGVRQNAVAAAYGVTPTCINAIVKGRSWRHLSHS